MLRVLIEAFAPSDRAAGTLLFAVFFIARKFTLAVEASANELWHRGATRAWHWLPMSEAPSRPHAVCNALLFGWIGHPVLE